jgi:hemolysin activation/secretion protein
MLYLPNAFPDTHQSTSMKSVYHFSVRPLLLALVPALCAAVAPVQAQQPPDAGQILQQLSPRQLAPSQPGPVITLPAALPDTALPGGTKVAVTAVRFTGNTVLTSEALLAGLGEFSGQSYDLAGLKALANRVADGYRAAGYPFARAYLPEQKLGGSELLITIVEGRYGQVVGGEAQAWLADLKPGAVIESVALERSTLILDDQPGIKTAPLMRPGQEPGTGDLVVNAVRTPGFAGDVSLDNHGSRYIGQYRATTSLRYDSPFIWGDQLTARALASDDNLWLGSLGYSAPLGASGLRGQVGYSHTAYTLGKNFSASNANGTAKTSSLGLSYPILRSQQVNLNLSGVYQHKALNDKNGLAASDDDKKSDSLALSLGFDRRDNLGGGGITYGALAYSRGYLQLSSVLTIGDFGSAQNTRGSFDKWNLDLARMQATSVSGVTLFGRLSAQRAGKNLDSSEGYSLGGAQGVRAYSQGEGTGDEGYFVQLEARYQMGSLAPYVFHDAGRVTVNANNAQLTNQSAANSRSLAGSGLGVRYSEGPLSVDAALAWRTHGGRPADLNERDEKPRAWVVGRYAF